MMKYISIYILITLLVFCTSTRGQNQSDSIAFYGLRTQVRDIKQDRKGNIWLATFNGIVRYDGKSFANITGELTSDRFFSVLEDRKGNFWFGTSGSGVYYYDGESFQLFTTKQGLVSNGILSIYEDKRGNIWFGGNNGDVSRYDGKSFQNFITYKGPLSGGVISIIEDRKGRIWFGTRGYAYVYEGDSLAIFKNKEGRPFSNVWSILEDKKGNIWLGGWDGLWRYDGREFANFSKNYVTDVYEDKKGTIWISAVSDSGQDFATTLKGFAIYRYNEDFPSGKNQTPTQLQSQLPILFRILEADDGNIWFAAVDGLYRYDGKMIANF